VDIEEQVAEAIRREKLHPPGITCDLDETYIETNEKMRDLVVAQISKLPGAPSPDELCWAWHNCKNHPFIARREVRELIDRHVFNPEYYRGLRVIPAARALREKLGKIVPFAAFLSARNESFREVTLETLADDLPAIPIILAPDNTAGEYRHQWKAETAAKLSSVIVAHIDDDPRIADVWNEWGVTLLLLGKHGVCKRNVVVCPSYDDVAANAIYLSRVWYWRNK
jgi:hypothetical protein